MIGEGAERIGDRRFAAKVMSADDAASFIEDGAHVGMSGFTGSGHPKAVPEALARRIGEAHGRGDRFTVGIWTGASTGPELDGALAAADGIDLRMPYQSDPVSRAKINAGEIDYLDLHLSHVAQAVWEGFFGHLDLALVEVAGITADGELVPSSSVGNNKTWLDLADRVILEVNGWQPAELEGMHDIYYGTALPPHRRPVPIVGPMDRIGVPYLRCPPDKVVAVVPTHAPDRTTTFRPADERSAQIAGHVVEFLAHEVKQGRLPPTLLPLQSGVGNVANAVLAGLDEGPFRPLTAYTEVLQDGMLAKIAKVGSYSIKAIGKPTRVKRLSAVRRGTRLTVRWQGGGASASRFGVLVSYPNGARSLHITHARRLVLDGVPARGQMSVSVTAINALGSRSGSVSAKVSSRAPKRKTRRRAKRHAAKRRGAKRHAR